jgi:hypothetical protein|tara:strand:+ start:1011 stop:1187 length:177 start_codon:yes stop_codon:yes gene_type:complete
MKDFFKKIFFETSALSWTIGGTGLVLITLSGETRQMGIYISVASFVFHMIGVLLSKEN